MPSSEQVLATGRGYRILKSDRRLIFERPDVGSSLFVKWLGLGLSFVAVIVSLAIGAQLFASPDERAGLLTAAVILIVLGIVAIFVGRRVLRSIRTPREKLGARLVLDETALHNEKGKTLAPRSTVHIRTSLDGKDGKGGLRIVSLCWPDARAAIFKSDDQEELRKVCQALAALELPTQS